jgi:hypothetical protein
MRREFPAARELHVMRHRCFDAMNFIELEHESAEEMPLQISQDPYRALCQTRRFT